jgi:predicted lipase
MPLAYDPSRTALYHPERHDTLFVRGQTYSPLQLAVEAARLAYYRAEADPVQRTRLADALAQVGFADLTLFADTMSGAEAFAAHRSTDGTTLLSFRGTQPDDYQDLIADLRVNLVAWPESAGRVHEGFAVAVRALRPQIIDWIESAKPEFNRMILTGHSLGAAMATLAASIWRPAWLVRIGSPRVGDAAFVATVAAKYSVRFVDCCDAVTEVPPEIGDYVHIKDYKYLTRDAGIVENPNPAFVQSDRSQARVEYSHQYFKQLLINVSVRDLADHAPINYARVMFEPTP